MSMESTSESETRLDKSLGNKIDSFFKSKAGLYFLLVLVFGFAIRIYYFFLTKDQALWWDALCYGSLARNFITHQWDSLTFILGETSIRPLFLPLLWSFLLRLKFSEVMVNITLGFVPSVLTIIFVYLSVKKVYNWRIALLSSFIFSISWIHVFYTYRLLTSIPALFFSTLSIYFFFKSLESDKIELKPFFISIFTLFISIFFRYNVALLALNYLVFLIFVKKLSFLKQQSFWIGSILGAIPIYIFFLINLIKYNSLFPALGIYAASAAEKTGYAFNTFSFFPHILQTPLLFAFILGLFLIIVKLFLGFDFISKNKEISAHFFFILFLVLNLAFLIFYIRYAEDRYLLECFLPIAVMASIGIDSVYLFIRKNNKVLAISFVFAFLAFSAYSQYVYGGPIITSKISSFKEMKQAFLWIDQNTPQDSVFLGEGIAPYSIYYSKRMYFEFSENSTQNLLSAGMLDFDYIVVNRFSTQPEALLKYIENISANLTQEKVFFFDEAQKEFAVIIFKRNQ